MGQRELIEHHGLNAAQQQANDDPALIASTSRVMADDQLQMSLLYSGFCVLALPHRRLPDNEKFVQSWANNTLEIEPGWLPGQGQKTPIGAPYGSYARLALLYLQTAALKADSPRVEVGGSMSAWLSRVGINTSGGKTRSNMKEQMLRLSACRMTITWPEDSGKLGFTRIQLIKDGVLAPDTLDSAVQGRLWADEVTLDDAFFRALKAHPVPVQEAAVRELVNNSGALDIYVWLAYRLHSLNSAVSIRWSSVMAQFGSGYKNIRSFRQRFRERLKLALAVYPDARVDVTDEGLILHPSHPPIPYMS